MATKGDVDVARHRLDRATQKRASGGLIFSSPVTSATASAPDAVDDALVDLARQQAQRQADQPGVVADHPLDGEMGLAGVGGAEDGGDAAGADGRREGNVEASRPEYGAIDARAP